MIFGHITKEVNIFNLRKQSRDLEDQTFVDYIENLTTEHEELKNKFELKDFYLDEIVDSVVEWASNPIVSTPETEFTNPSSESFPSLELKALPEHLKYEYLDENDTLLVIIASHLTREQEESFDVYFKERIGSNWMDYE